MRNFILITAVVLTSFFGLESCSKTTNGKWMIFTETTCLPFWANESSNRKSINTLETFLKAEGIIPLNIKIVGDREITCEFCDCPTGLEYHVKVDKSQIGEMAYWGFKLK